MVSGASAGQLGVDVGPLSAEIVNATACVIDGIRSEAAAAVLGQLPVVPCPTNIVRQAPPNYPTTVVAPTAVGIGRAAAPTVAPTAAAAAAAVVVPTTVPAMVVPPAAVAAAAAVAVVAPTTVPAIVAPPAAVAAAAAVAPYAGKGW